MKKISLSRGPRLRIGLRFIGVDSWVSPRISEDPVTWETLHYAVRIR